jgi:hypothetical protein
MNKHILRNHCLALLLCSGTALAHDNAFFDTHATAHGGQVRMAGAYHVEAVLEQKKLVLYVTDHADQPQSTNGWQGRVTVLNGTQVSRLALNSAGDNRLRSDTSVSFGADARMVVLLQLPDAEVLELSYTPATAAGGVASHP